MLSMYLFMPSSMVAIPPPKSASKYIKKLEDFCKKINLGEIKTVSGRFYAMDRDNRWDRTHLAYDAIACASSSYLNPQLSKPSKSHTLEENLMNS